MKTQILIGLTTISLLIIGCSNQYSTNKIIPKDGELALPNSYEQWPVFISNIEKSNGKQIRDIYINQKGKQTKKGDSFPNGTQFVMTLYKTQTDNYGKLTKGDLDKIFIMSKGENWGTSLPDTLRNGDWVYSAFNADGSRAKVNYDGCRACHLPLSNKDYIFHYDQFFK
jgi:hemoglobin